MLLNLIDSYESPDAQELLRVGADRLSRPRRHRRELLVDGVAAGSFLIAATLLAGLAPWPRSLTVGHVILVLALWAAVERVKFPVADGWSYPTLLVFVPALFILPAPIVPLVAVLAVLVRAAPVLAQRQCSPAMLLSFISDAWFALGPALVFTLAGVKGFEWTNWPVYAAALAAELVFDAGGSLLRVWFAERIRPAVQIPLLGWIYLFDVALAPLGLLIAAAAVKRPGLLFIALSPLAMLLAFARERRQRLENSVALSSAYRGTALLLADVVEADDEYTGVHSRNVVELSLAVADALRLSAQQRRNVEFAALLHDVGKIQVPKEIIHKPSRLDEQEWAIMRQHTIFGESMLRRVGGILGNVGGYVRSSHERFDGLGYPDGLRGMEIPIESRIVAACDAFSAMTTNRPYRQAMNINEAIEELERCAGSQFDEVVVRELVRLVRAGRAISPGDYELAGAGRSIA